MVRKAIVTKNPAVAAGLTLPAAALCVPQIALAAPASHHVITSDAYLDFALGIAVGVGLTGGCIAAGSAVAAHRRNKAMARLRVSPPPEVSKPLHAAATGSIPVGVDEQAAMDYADFAESYVRSTMPEELAHVRPRTVREVLEERLSEDAMDGVPVIERADGSVGDVGTPWWNDQVGESVRRLGDTPGWSDAIPHVADQTDPSAVEAIDRRARASRINRYIPRIDSEAFPEHSAEEDEDAREDMWETALLAMSENYGHSGELYGTFEIIKGSSDPDQEMSTGYIPLRTYSTSPDLGTAPDFTDTDSYLNYLVNDELSRSSEHAPVGEEDDDASLERTDSLAALQSSQSLKSTARLDRVRLRQKSHEAGKPKHMAPSAREDGDSEAHGEAHEA